MLNGPINMMQLEFERERTDGRSALTDNRLCFGISLGLFATDLHISVEIGNGKY